MIQISTKEKAKKALKENQTHSLIMATEVEVVEGNIEEGVVNIEGEGTVEEVEVDQ
jgi:hypothetical protein